MVFDLQAVVIDEVDSFLFRPHLGARAQYHAVCPKSVLLILFYISQGRIRIICQCLNSLHNFSAYLIIYHPSYWFV